ncbi:hypothetical protein CKO_00620 [Citrobacter koseri ATCC BAA-895]|uniref:Uncharacterized protein n=1 Tax=Citrobacter koseri (strain ATCC BAA-895 / CDC 4225-83 / SGSC4696) TaxID=290338 RepID=A8AE62_CITK8|nr:hypothetical protein CKO_00620 [Citrobacter koseri ATCC BAA-895]
MAASPYPAYSNAPRRPDKRSAIRHIRPTVTHSVGLISAAPSGISDPQ